MRFKWIVLLLLLMLPIMIADIDNSMEGHDDSSSIADKQHTLRSGRFKRRCCCGGGGGGILVIRCNGGIGQKEMFRNWWLHIPLLVLPMSMSWMKAPLS